MEPVTEPGPMRDPQGNLERYRSLLAIDVLDRGKMEQELPAMDLPVRVHRMTFQMAHDLTGLRYRYAMGVPLPELRDRVSALSKALLADTRFITEHGNESYRVARPLIPNQRPGLAFAALALLLVEEGDMTTWFHELELRQKDHQSQLFDTLVKAFVPKQPVEKKYKADKYQGPWCDPILRALALRNPYSYQQMTKNSHAWSAEFRRALQRRLRDAGAFEGRIDGAIRASTIAAIDAYVNRNQRQDTRQPAYGNASQPW